MTKLRKELESLGTFRECEQMQAEERKAATHRGQAGKKEISKYAAMFNDN